MPPAESGDDVIRIRIDSAAAIEDFLDLLRRQAEEGETRAPANPANRAVFREMAPFCLVEYEYIGGGIGTVEGVYLGFADGAVYSAQADVPDEAVDSWLADDPLASPPVYVYVVLAAPAPAAAIARHLDLLAGHVGHPVVGIWLGADGRAEAHAGCGVLGVSSPRRRRLEAEMAAAAAETCRHLSKAEILRRVSCQSLSPDGSAYARLKRKFAEHVIRFGDAASRDDFVAWSLRKVAEPGSCLVRAAEPCAPPLAGVQVVHASADCDWGALLAVLDVSPPARH